MNPPTITLAERAQTKLRLAVATVERSLSDLSVRDEHSHELEELRRSWRAFLDLLALGPEPERRACPFCNGPIRFLATRCVHCWKESREGP